MPDIKLDTRGKECLVAIDMVLAKLWDSCREAERRDEVGAGAGGRASGRKRARERYTRTPTQT